MADGSQVPQSLLASLASQLGGPQSIAPVQRSQYLADALRSMQGAGTGLKTAGALGTNLMAEALLNYARQRNDAKLMGVVGNAQNTMFASGNDLLNPPASGTAGAAAAPPSLSQIGGGIASAVPSAATTAQAFDPKTMAALLSGGSGADAPAGMSAAAPPPPPPGAAWQDTLTQARANPQAFFGGAVGAPVSVNSGYRSPAHNARVGGSSTSEHMTNSAWDLSAPGMSSGQLADKLAGANLPFDQIIDEPAGNDAHFGMGPTGQERGLVERQTGPHQYDLLGQMGQLGPGQQAPPPSAFAAGGGGLNGQSPQSTATGEQGPPAPRPLQVSTGPDPSVATPQANASPFAAAGAGIGAAAQSVNPQGFASPGVGQAAPAPGAGGVPFGQPGWQPPPVPITDQERAALLRLRGLAQQAPQLYMQQYQSEVQRLHQQISTPEPLDISRPNDAGQVTITGKLTGQVYGVQSPGGVVMSAQPRQVSNGQGGFSTVPSTAPRPLVSPQERAAAGIPAGDPNAYAMDAAGRVTKIADAQARPLTDPVERARYGIQPNDQSAYAVGPDGKASKVADAPFNFQGAAGLVSDLTKSEQYTKASHATDMYRSAINAAGRPGGIPDAELVDFAAQEMSGGVARQFNQKMIAEGQGPWARLQQFGPQLLSGQGLSPPARQALLQSMRDYAAETQGTFGSLASSSGAMARAGGYDITPFVAPLMRPLPPVPGMAGIPNGGAPPPSAPAPQTAPSDADAAAAELKRRGYRLVNGQWTR